MDFPLPGQAAVEVLGDQHVSGGAQMVPCTCLHRPRGPQSRPSRRPLWPPHSPFSSVVAPAEAPTRSWPGPSLSEFSRGSAGGWLLSAPPLTTLLARVKARSLAQTLPFHRALRNPKGTKEAPPHPLKSCWPGAGECGGLGPGAGGRDRGVPQPLSAAAKLPSARCQAQD